MSYSGPYTGIFYSGSPISSLVPSVYPVGIAGRPYFIDTNPEAFDFRWRHETIPLMRSQADQARTPAETSLNPDTLWRRAQDSWHRGAGQDFLDRDELQDPYRFQVSKGVDVWTHYELSLLPDVDEKLASANTNLFMVVAGARLYVADGAVLKYTSSITVDAPSWTTVTYAGGAILSLASDGFNVYLTDGANVYTTNTGISTTSSVSTEDIDVLGFVKGRLLGAEDGEIFQFATAATPTTLFTPDLTGTAFTWVGFAEGNTVVYMAGYTGDKSTIWKTAITADGTALAVPTIAGTLPDGEIIRAIYGYLGNIFIGTDLGWRFATADTNGNLAIGVLVETPNPVLCFEGQGHFVWFGYTNYDGDSTGLGRADFTEFTGVPNSNQIAYASDLMLNDDGAVKAVVTFQGIQVFSVSGEGVYAATTTLVAEASIDSGEVGFGLPDLKTVVYIDVRTRPLLGGSWSVELSCDEGEFMPYGQSIADEGGTGAQAPAECTAEKFNLRILLERDVTTPTVGPEILRWTLKAFPSPQDGQIQRLFLPLVLARDLSGFGVDAPLDPRYEHDFIDNLRTTREIIPLQEIDRTYYGTIDDNKYLPYATRVDEDNQWRFPDGTMLVVFKELG